MIRKFVINPRARGVNPRTLAEMKKFFTVHGSSFETVVCDDPRTIEQTVGRLIDEGVEQIVAVGGDGTVQAAANGFFREGKLRSERACLAVAKAGTGSDYWRNLAQKNKTLDWREVVVNHQLGLVDVGVIEWGANFEHQRRFLNIASFGWSADVVIRKADAPKWLPATISYVWPTVRSLLGRQAQVRSVTIDGETVKAPLLALFVTKGTFAGGGMRFGDQVKLDDGKFDLVWFQDLTLLEIFTRFAKLFQDGLRAEPKIMRRTGRTIEILDSLPGEIDGEYLSPIGPYRIRIEPRALPLCIPV